MVNLVNFWACFKEIWILNYITVMSLCPVDLQLYSTLDLIVQLFAKRLISKMIVVFIPKIFTSSDFNKKISMIFKYIRRKQIRLEKI